MIKRNKNKDAVALWAQWKLTTRLKNRNSKLLKSKHYYQVYLWNSLEHLRKNSLDSEDAQAVCNHNHTTMIVSPDGTEIEYIPPKLGEIHFAFNYWNEEIVSHEILHAVFNVIRTLMPEGFKMIESQEDYASNSKNEFSTEEYVCYLFGQWVHCTFTELWKANPNKNWKKVKQKAPEVKFKG